MPNILDSMETMHKNNEIIMNQFTEIPSFNPKSEKSNFFSKVQSDKKLNIDFNPTHQNDITLDLNYSSINHRDDYFSGKRDDFGHIPNIQEEDNSIELNDLQDLQSFRQMMNANQQP